MRVYVRDELCTNKPTNLKRLSPKMKILVGILTKWKETSFYKKAEQKRADAIYSVQLQRDEKLKDSLLALIYRELNTNTTLAGKDDVCVSIVFGVSSKYKDSLERILKHKDFLPYNAELIKENQDMRKAFSNIPILVRFSKKAL